MSLWSFLAPIPSPCFMWLGSISLHPTLAPIVYGNPTIWLGDLLLITLALSSHPILSPWSYKSQLSLVLSSAIVTVKDLRSSGHVKWAQTSGQRAKIAVTNLGVCSVILALGQRACSTSASFVPWDSRSRHSESCRVHGRTKALRSSGVPLLLSIKLL